MSVFYFDNIEVAMAESLRRGFPLLVCLHAAPDVDLTSAQSPHTTADDIHFLPAAYAVATYNLTTTTTTTDSTDSAETPAPAPLLKDAPAFWRVSKPLVGEAAYQLNPDFPLGSVHGGTAQRIALDTAIRQAGLAQTAVLVRLAEGEPGFAQFTSAMAALPTGPLSPPPLPRVYVFTPNSATRVTSTAPGAGHKAANSVPPFVLYAQFLTPRRLVDHVRHSLSFPQDPALMVRQQQMAALARARDDGAGASSAAATSGSRSAPTGGQGFAFAWKQHFLSDVEAARQGPGARTAPASSSSAVARPTTAAAGGEEAAAKSLADTAAMRQRALHMLHLIGLPFQRTKIIFVTTPSMTLRTVWQDVTFTLQCLQRELEQCQELDQWDKFGGEKAAAKMDRVALADEVARWFMYASTCAATLGKRTFTLRILPPAEAATSAEPRMVSSAEEAQKIHAVNLATGTRIEVVFTDEYATQYAQTSTAKSTTAKTTTTTTTTTTTGGTVVCDGDVCRRVPASFPSTSSSPPTAATTTTTPTPTALSAPGAAAAGSPTPASSSATVITLRCALPVGGTLTCENLDPTVATLARDVRPLVVARLGHDRFHFVQTHPLQHFSATEDEATVLAGLGIRSSRAVRVALESDAPVATTQHADPAGAFGRLRNLFGGAGPQTSQNTQNTQSKGPAAHAPARGPRSMSELLAAREEEEREDARRMARRDDAHPGEGHEDDDEEVTKATTPEGLQALLKRFGKQVRQQQEQQQQPERGPGGGGGGGSGSEGQRPGKSQRYNGPEGGEGSADTEGSTFGHAGAGRRLGGGDGQGES